MEWLTGSPPELQGSARQRVQRGKVANASGTTVCVKPALRNFQVGQRLRYLAGHLAFASQRWRCAFRGAFASAAALDEGQLRVQLGERYHSKAGTHADQENSPAWEAWLREADNVQTDGLPCRELVATRRPFASSSRVADSLMNSCKRLVDLSLSCMKGASGLPVSSEIGRHCFPQPQRSRKSAARHELEKQRGGDI